MAGMLAAPRLRAQAVLTWHNDAARTGQNLQETLLSPANVDATNFGLRFTLSVDGKVDAQPLYIPQVTVSSVVHNLVIVATENDTLYAFDADTGAQIWTTASTTTLVPAGESVSDLPRPSCNQVTPTIGITSTPAIDMSSGPHGTIYLVAMTKDGSSHYHQRLHAVDVVTGLEISGWPIDIAATYPYSGGTLTFDPSQYKERAALLISNGVVYTTWASHCDITPYNSWLIGYNESTKAQTVLNLTPNGSQGGVWQAGGGPAADAGGNLYFLLGNGTFDTSLNGSGFPSSGDFGNAFVNISTNGGLAVKDYFTMDNTVSESGSDQDLGSGGPMLLPVLNDALGYPHELAVGAGKDGNAYVVDRNNMGKFSMSSNAVYQQLDVGASGCTTDCIFSSPAWFNNTLYFGAKSTHMSAYPYSGGSFGSASHTSTTTFGNPGATPSISAASSQMQLSGR